MTPVTMEDLIAQGRAAYVAALKRIYDPANMPIGVEGVSVVTRADFDAHPAMCREYATRARSLYILDGTGGPELLMCRVTARE